MTRTRLTPWVVLACIGTLAACTSTEGGQQGNTELNILIPNQSPDSTTGQTPIECNSVEYTIVCNGDQQPAGGFLNPNDGFVDAVTLNGNLEVDNNATIPIAQGYMDIPPGNCLAQLRCRDGDGEVICSGDNVLASTADQTVVAGQALPVNIVLDCNNISAQAPVGQLDVRGSFAFAIGNWCPDLFVLNCVDTDLFPVDADPGPEVEGQTTCEVRYRDNDGGCNEGCDPQFCQEDANGLLACTPASPPEDQNGVSMAGVNVRTTVECGGAPMDCANNGTFGGSTSCTYDGDSIGFLPTNINSQTVPNPRDFGVNCDNAGPGESIVCTATTTDGDRDCDKTKTVVVNCAGLTACGTYGEDNGESSDQAGGDAVCQSTESLTCTSSVCDNSLAGADGVCTGRECCDDTAINEGDNCSSEIPEPIGVCTNGACTPDVCVDDPGCNVPANPCLTNSTCDTNSGLCSARVDRDGEACMEGAITDGVCDADTCISVVCRDPGTAPGTPVCPAVACNTVACDEGVPGGQCVSTPDDTQSCNSCGNAGGVAGCECVSGSCDNAPLPGTCQRFATVPVPSETQGVCEKIEFIAIDCELLANSAPLPLNASAQAVDIDADGPLTDIAYAGDTIGVYVQDAFVLPSSLVCGFLGAGFSSSGVGNSIIDNSISNAFVSTPATPTSALVYSFLDDGSDTPNLVSPHGVVTYSFADACGDNCVDGFCASDSSIACEALTFTDDCSVENGGAVGTGPGIFAPFLANAPGRILVDTTTGELTPQVGPVVLTPTAAGSVNFQLDYATTAILLPDLVGSIVTQACVGGACESDVCSAENFNGACDVDSTCSIRDVSGGPFVRCADDLSPCDIANGDADCAGTGICFGTSGQACTDDAQCPDITGPRVMYEATCSKAGFGACGGTQCGSTADCPLAAAGQTCDTGLGLCNNVNEGSCGGGAADLCFVLGTQTAAPCATDDDCDAVITAASGGQIETCCAPFGIYPDVADACKGAAPDDKPVECCVTGFVNNDDSQGVDGNPFDTNCTNAANRRRCCVYYQDSYPTSTPAQEPQLWVNP